jgi:hypothetical protein
MVDILWGNHPVLNVVQNLFNGQLLFVLKFLGEVILVFIAGGLIGKLLHLDKAYKSESMENL